MKFGRRLLEESDDRYRHFYIAYKDLKQAIKLITGSSDGVASISEVTHNFGNLPALAGSIYRPPESRFQDLLNHEKEKINKFMSVNLTAVVSALKQLLKDLLREDPQDEGFRDDSCLPLSEVDQQSEMLIFLKSYQLINQLGFRKITKKYDKHNQSKSSHWYLAQLQRESFVNADFNTPLKLLSLCYQIILARQNTTFAKESLLMSGSINLMTSGPTSPVDARETSYYLIRPEDLMKTKILLAKSLPLMSIGTCCFVGREAVDVLINPLAAIQPSLAPTTKKSRASTTETSKFSHGYLYFDSRSFTAVKQALAASASNTGKILRVRWFGVHDGESDKDVYIERVPTTKGGLELSHESRDLMSEEFSMGEDREIVMLKSKHLNCMLTNSFDVDSWIRRKAVDPKYHSRVKGLLDELQNKLSSGDLLPILQVWCYRTTFTLQATEDSPSPVVEAHIDENLCSVSELKIENGEILFNSTIPDQVITPFTQIKSEAASLVQNQFCTLTLTYPKDFRFPYPLNQPRLEENGGSLFDTELADITIAQFQKNLTLVTSAHEAHDFNHLAHAAASLFSSTKTFKLRTPAWFRLTLVAGQMDDSDEEDERKAVEAETSNPPKYSSTNRRSSNKYISDDIIHPPASFSQGGAAGNHVSNPPAIELLPAPKYLDQPVSQRGGFLGLDATAIPVQEEPTSMGLREPLLNERNNVPAQVNRSVLSRTVQWWNGLMPRRNAQPNQQSTSASVRVEPKTFFANERTLLQWMNIAVLISTISITLMTLGTMSSRLAGFILAPIAIYFILHSYSVYNRRTRALLNKEPIDYVDHRGPIVLVVSLVFAMSAVVLINIAKVFDGSVSGAEIKVRA